MESCRRYTGARVLRTSEANHCARLQGSSHIKLGQELAEAHVTNVFPVDDKDARFKRIRKTVRNSLCSITTRIIAKRRPKSGERRFLQAHRKWSTKTMDEYCHWIRLLQIGYKLGYVCLTIPWRNQRPSVGIVWVIKSCYGVATKCRMWKLIIITRNIQTKYSGSMMLGLWNKLKAW